MSLSHIVIARTQQLFDGLSGRIGVEDQHPVGSGLCKLSGISLDAARYRHSSVVLVIAQAVRQCEVHGRLVLAAHDPRQLPE